MYNYSDLLLKEFSNDEFDQIEHVFNTESFIDRQDFVIESGKSNVLLSAPHSVEQLREGKKKIAETRTGLIVMALKKIMDVHAIYKIKNNNDDANYDVQSDYKDVLIEYIKREGVKCILDFHISSAERPYSIDIGTGNKKNIVGRNDLLKNIYNILSVYYPNVVIDRFFSASNPNTVSSTISKGGKIPAFQLEINWKLISDYEKFRFFLNCMSNVIKKLEVEV